MGYYFNREDIFEWRKRLRLQEQGGGIQLA